MGEKYNTKKKTGRKFKLLIEVFLFFLSNEN